MIRSSLFYTIEVVVVVVVVVLLQYPLQSAAAASRRRVGHPNSRSVTVINRAGSGVSIDVFWIHLRTRELADSHTGAEGVVSGSETHIQSYVGHEFEIHELPNKKTGKCRQAECKKAYFKVNEYEDQLVKVNEDFSLEREDGHTRALDQAKRYLAECRALVEQTASGNDKMEQLAACVLEHAERAIAETQKNIHFEANVRTDIAERLVPYACHPQTNMTQSDAIENTTIKIGRSSYLVETMFQSHGSEILLVHDFLTESQCRAMQQYATIVLPTDDADANVQKRQIPATPAVLQDGVVRSVLDKLESIILRTTRHRIPYTSIQSGTLMQVHLYGNTDDHHEDNSFVAQGCVMNDDGTCADGGNFGTAAHTASAAAHVQPHRVIRQHSNELNDDDEDTMTTHSSAHLDYVIICSAPTAGGALHFPKTGVHISTSSSLGDMILIRYERDRQRESDPIHMLVDEYMICPAAQGQQVVLITDGM